MKMAKPKADSAGFDFNVQTTESFSWSSAMVEDLNVAIDDGYKPKQSPFYEGNPNLRKGNIVFTYTAEEIREIKRCATDIVYFANTYCTVMTDDGLMTIKLRPYQESMLHQFQAERFNCCLASRQIGKCHISLINILRNGIIEKITIGRLYFEILKQQRKLTFLEKCKHFLYKLYEKLDSFDNKQVCT